MVSISFSSDRLCYQRSSRCRCRFSLSVCVCQSPEKDVWRSRATVAKDDEEDAKEEETHKTKHQPRNEPPFGNLDGKLKFWYGALGGKWRTDRAPVALEGPRGILGFAASGLRPDWSDQTESKTKQK